jgi:hypothetical protein
MESDLQPTEFASFAISEPSLADSLSFCHLEGSLIADVGVELGTPGIPVAPARPAGAWQCWTVPQKGSLWRQAVLELKLTNVEVVTDAPSGGGWQSFDS